MYSGVIVPMVTPLTERGTVCADSVDRLVASLAGQVSALMPTLSSGEGWRLTQRQWQDMVASTCEYGQGLPVLAGVQCPDTPEVTARAQLASKIGADAVVVTTPFRPGLSQEEIFQHYTRLREAVDIPIFVYNEEAVSGNPITLETLSRICRLPGVVGVKESSGSPELTRQLVAAVDVPVFQGWENLLGQVPEVAGFIGPLANLEPALCGAMLRSPSAPRQAEIDDACRKYGLFEPDWYRHVKQELKRRGVITSDQSCDERSEQ